MRTRVIWFAAAVFCLCGLVEAQNTVWTPSPGKNLWSDPGNWSNGLPNASLKPVFNSPGECIIDFEGAEAWQISNGGGPLRIIEGGTLTVLDWFIVGYHADEVGDDAGHVEVLDGGVLDCQARFYVGYRGEGHLRVYEGGTVNVHRQLFGVGQQPGGNGFVELEGGSLNLLEGTNALGLNFLPTAQSSVNLSGGALTLRGTTENLDYLDQAITDGIIKAYGGIGEVVVDPNTEPGRLIVRGIHPFIPFPTDDGIAPAGQIELSWVLPDPCTPGQPVAVDVYFTDDLQSLEQFLDPASIRVVNKQSVTSTLVQTQPKKRYYWAVDSYIGSAADPVYGPIFSFVADNLPPDVDVGPDIVTWLQDGARTGNLDATVTDDDAYTVQWTVVSEPNQGDATIQAVGAEDTGITLSALGEYVLQLEASDGEYSGSDTVTINVYNDSCQAAQSLPDYEPLVGDLNGDCRVDDADMALLQEQWLADNSLTDEWYGL